MKEGWKGECEERDKVNSELEGSLNEKGNTKKRRKRDFKRGAKESEIR